MADKNMERHSMPLGFRAMWISREERPPHPAWDMNWTARGKGRGSWNPHALREGLRHAAAAWESNLAVP